MGASGRRVNQSSTEENPARTLFQLHLFQNFSMMNDWTTEPFLPKFHCSSNILLFISSWILKKIMSNIMFFLQKSINRIRVALTFMAVLLSQPTEKRNCDFRAADKSNKQNGLGGSSDGQFIKYWRNEGNLIVAGPKVSRWPPLFFKPRWLFPNLLTAISSIWKIKGDFHLLWYYQAVSILLLPKTALYVRMHVSNSSYSSPPPFIYPYLCSQGSYLLLYLLYNLFHFIRGRKEVTA